MLYKLIQLLINQELEYTKISFNEKLLKKLQSDTKNLIKNLYINCEKDYIDSTKTFNKMLQISNQRENIDMRPEDNIKQEKANMKNEPI